MTFGKTRTKWAVSMSDENQTLYINNISTTQTNSYTRWWRGDDLCLFCSHLIWELNIWFCEVLQNKMWIQKLKLVIPSTATNLQESNRKRKERRCCTGLVKVQTCTQANESWVVRSLSQVCTESCENVLFQRSHLSRQETHNTFRCVWKK